MESLLRSSMAFVCTLIVVYISSFDCVHGEIYESIQWSSENPKFHFSKGQFKDGLAFLRRPVSLMSQVNIVCPNVGTILTNTTKQSSQNNLYENLWMVGKEEFHSCTVDRSQKRNKLIHLCNKPGSLYYYTVQFMHNMTGHSLGDENEATDMSFYFIGTSNGSKSSLNNTSGGHCLDEAEGLSMRIWFIICTTNSSDPSCQVHQQSSNNKTKTNNCRNVTRNVTVLNKTSCSGPSSLEVIGITIAVALAVSLVINGVFIIYFCAQKKQRQKMERQASHHSQKTSEPLKSLITEPYTKKSKHGRVSAAL